MFVLYIAFQQCRKEHSHSSTTAQSDVFTFNMAAIQMVGVLGTSINTLSVHVWPDLPKVGIWLQSIMTIGQTLLHVLACFERYLAVVHPISYLHLKKNGTIMRNISIVVVWLFSIGMVCVQHYKIHVFGLLAIIFIGILSFMLVLFFCASVLYVLICPGPGESSGGRKHIDQSKRSAFHTVAAITIALMFMFIPVFVLYMVYLFGHLNESELCLFGATILWIYFPSILVMPVLFLYHQTKQRKK